MSDTKEACDYPDRNDTDTDVVEETIAAHRALHNFMTGLLNEASVTALHTFLIQDNASILTKSASRSFAHAAHKRFLLGRDHLITKEISRWESYPFEVDQPIVVSRPKKAKNGCVPQRRAKRRSGLESAGEIKADILKKAESLPRAPRRRSSVITDDLKRATTPASFEEVGCSISPIRSRINEQPRRELSPHRLATPKKPIRRVSQVPDDLPSIYHNPQSSRPGSDLIGGDSQHSVASTESTLSELGARQFDLSSISETSDLLPTIDPRSLDCSVIFEEEDEFGEEPTGGPLPQRGRLKPISSSETIPRIPTRRVSEMPEDHDTHRQKPATTGTKTDETKPPLNNTESTISLTAEEKSGEHRFLDCTMIQEEEGSDVEQDGEAEKELPPLQDHSGKDKSPEPAD